MRERERCVNGARKGEEIAFGTKTESREKARKRRIGENKGGATLRKTIDMLFRLAWKNIWAKPARAIATVIAIAAAVAMIFAMLSFKPAVYEYMYSTQTAISGGYDIRIATSSSSDRLTATAGLVDEDGTPKIDGIERVVPSLKLFATVGEDYVQVRGFEYSGAANAEKDIQILQHIDVESGELKNIRPDDAVISRAAAKHFGVWVGDEIRLSLGGRTKRVFVKAIAKDSGYFMADSPYLVLGFSGALSELIVPGAELCNEIYVKAKSGADIDALIGSIKALPQYANMLVNRAGNEGSAREQATSLTAPIVLAGAAVMALAVCAIVLLFLMSEKEKFALVSRLRVIGATKGQISFAIAAEGLMLAAAGALLGAGVAVGVFVGIIRLTLSASASFTLSAWRLLGAEAIGFVVAAASSLVPMIRAFAGTVRENLIAADNNKSKWTLAAAIVLAAAGIAAFAIVLADVLPSRASAGVGVALLATALAALALGLPHIVRAVGKLISKCKSPSVKTAGIRLARDKRPSRSAAVLGVGMSISMLLFMAWSLTTSIFGAYIADFENMAIVSNVQASVDVAEFEAEDCVRTAVKLVWQQGRLSGNMPSRSVRILGSKDVLELTKFGFVTDENIVRERLASDGDFVFVDAAFARMYAIAEGDKVALSLENKTMTATVGGILSHRLFDGAYVVVNENVLDRAFNVKPDTVLIVANGDVHAAVGALSEKFSAKNYYVIEALEAFKWDMQTVESVFDLIGTLAFVVAAFILAVTVANALVGRAGEEKSRRALLSAGMSKNMLLESEIAEHGILAAVCYVLAFALAAPMTVGLVAALELFGLSFEFMFEAWVVATVGIVMAAIYALTPLLCGFRKGYTLVK